MPPSPAPLPRDSAPRLADFIVRRHRALLTLVVVLSVAAAWRTKQLTLHTDFAELLPEKDPAVVVLRDMGKRIQALSTVVVVVESPSPEANRRYVDAMVPRLQALRTAAPEISEIEWGVQAEQQFVRKNKYLYASVEEIEDALQRLRREILKRKNPAFVDLSGDDEPLSASRSTLDKKESDLLGKFPDGYYATRDRRVYAVVLRVRGSIFSERPVSALVGHIRQAASSLHPARYDPAMTVGLTGDIVTSLEERQALEDDLVMATTVCVVLVCLVILLFYGRPSAVPYAVLPALLGVNLALAFAQLAYGYLNASTAFMGSIIVGNGINYSIIQMARYEEERRHGRSVKDAIAVALGATWRATAIASLGAAMAYGSLAITDFRGFNQFGYIGGVGMLVSWGLTLLVLPSLWVMFDRRRAHQTTPRVRGFALAGPFARFTVRYPRLLLGLGATVTLLALVPLRSYVKDPFEYDFRRLRNQQSRFSGAGKLGYKLDPIFGRSLSPSFILADAPEQVEEIRTKLREQDRRFGVVGDVKTINDFLPGTPAVQAQKLDLLGRIRRLVDANLELMDDKERADLVALRPPDGLVALGKGDLPRSISRYFTEADGTIGRPLVYYARDGIPIWDGRTLIKLAAVTQEIRLGDGKTVRTSGSPAIFAGMLNSIVRDGPIATAAAFFGVAALVIVLTFRRGGALLILGVLVTGVLWMVGAAAAAGVRINFLNFIALPITFGIGVDYGVNLYLRYVEEGRGRVAAAVEATGAAVALCSVTTIIGYAALLVADNQALRSFGSLAILGEFACITAALVILPAVLILLERRRRSGA